MKSNRNIKISSEIQGLAAKFIQMEANTDPLITVTNATIAPNMSRATIYFTTIPADREQDALIFLKRSGKEMRTYIKKNLPIRTIPFLEFSVDYGERHRQHIDKLMLENSKKHEA